MSEFDFWSRHEAIAAQHEARLAAGPYDEGGPSLVVRPSCRCGFPLGETGPLGDDRSVEIRVAGQGHCPLHGWMPLRVEDRP